MVNTCANPRCEARFQRLGEGKLFLDDGKSGSNASAELVDNSYWLCNECAGKYTIEFSENGALLVSNDTGDEERVA